MGAGLLDGQRSTGLRHRGRARRHLCTCGQLCGYGCCQCGRGGRRVSGKTKTNTNQRCDKRFDKEVRERRLRTVVTRFRTADSLCAFALGRFCNGHSRARCLVPNDLVAIVHGASASSA